ncbi:MAG: hypothetical protein QOF53_1931 [Nocardioidaceae bacterium]|jgi:hypothetical protein|nr:hypothetical protein [Nocardioidaceae bacterium]
MLFSNSQLPVFVAKIASCWFGGVAIVPSRSIVATKAGRITVRSPAPLPFV